jgi:cell division protein FtsA
MRYITTGIDIGTEQLKVCVIEHSSKEKLSRVLGFFMYPILGVRKGYIYNDDIFSKSLRKIIDEIEKQIDYKIESAVLSSGSTSIQSKILSSSSVISKADGEVTHFDVENIEKQLNESSVEKTRKVIFDEIIEYKIDNKITQGLPIGMKGVKLEIKKLFIDILNQHYDTLEAIFLENDIDVSHIYPKGVCAGDKILNEKEKMVGVMYMDLGSETTTISVYENNFLIGYHTIPIGSNDITNDIALGLKISLEEAEQVKRGLANKTYSKKKIDDIVFSRIEDICELSNSYLKKIKRNELLPGGVIINGGGSEIIGIEEYLKKYLNLPVKKAFFESNTQKKGLIKQTDFIESYALALLHNEEDSNKITGNKIPLIEKIKKNSSNFFKQFLP